MEGSHSSKSFKNHENVRSASYISRKEDSEHTRTTKHNAEDFDEKVSTSDSESELSNNCGSLQSEDESDEETFGKSSNDVTDRTQNISLQDHSNALTQPQKQNDESLKKLPKEVNQSNYRSNVNYNQKYRQEPKKKEKTLSSNISNLSLDSDDGGSLDSAEKLTYVGGKRSKEKNKLPKNINQKRIVWDNDICASQEQNIDGTRRKSSDDSTLSKQEPGYRNPHSGNERDMNNKVYKQSYTKRRSYSTQEEYKRQDCPGTFSDDRDYVQNRGIKENTKFYKSHVKTNYPKYSDKSVNEFHYEEKLNNVPQNIQEPNEEAIFPHKNNWNIRIPSVEEEQNNRGAIFRESKDESSTSDLFYSYESSISDTIDKRVHKSKEEYLDPLPGFRNLEEPFAYSSSHNTSNTLFEVRKPETSTNYFPRSTDNVVDKQLSPENNNMTRSFPVPKEDYTFKKSEMIKDAKEVADLIVGSQRGLDMFMSFYNEWTELRKQSILFLEQISEAIIRSSRKSAKIREVIGGVNYAADAAAMFPQLSFGARIASSIATFIGRLFGGLSAKDIEKKQFEIKQTFQKDIDTSSMVYIYGVQCASQFEETCKFIKKFHEKIQSENYMSATHDDNILDFLRNISEYSPSNMVVFYKRLRICYEILINSKSKEGRAFCRVFEDVPDAVNTINLLPWRFDPDGFDNSIVLKAWEELFALFYHEENTSMDDFNHKIQNCILFLIKERSLLDRSIANLQREKM